LQQKLDIYIINNFFQPDFRKRKRGRCPTDLLTPVQIWLSAILENYAHNFAKTSPPHNIGSMTKKRKYNPISNLLGFVN
jgi:hypothetical protein